MFKLLVCIGLVLFIWNFVMKPSQKSKITSTIDKVKENYKKAKGE